MKTIPKELKKELNIINRNNNEVTPMPIRELVIIFCIVSYLLIAKEIIVNVPLYIEPIIQKL